MADKTYKLTATLSTGEEIDCGTFTAPQGPQGETGPQGPQGESALMYNDIVTIAESHKTPVVGNKDDLPNHNFNRTPNINDYLFIIYCTADNTTTYITWDQITKIAGGRAYFTFTKVVEITGPQGPQGKRGPQGPKGDTGAQGPTGGAGRLTACSYLGECGEEGSIEYEKAEWEFLLIAYYPDSGATSRKFTQVVPTAFINKYASNGDASNDFRLTLPDGILSFYFDTNGDRFTVYQMPSGQGLVELYGIAYG